MGLPTAQHVANLVAISYGASITAAAVTAAEIHIMGLLNWQPLTGWDDFKHCKGVPMPPALLLTVHVSKSQCKL